MIFIFLKQIFFAICYFIFFLPRESQYFSIILAPSTLNNASWVAILPQLTQCVILPPTSSNGRNDYIIIFYNDNYKWCSILVLNIWEKEQLQAIVNVRLTGSINVRSEFLIAIMHSLRIFNDADGNETAFIGKTWIWQIFIFMGQKMIIGNNLC